MLKDPYIILDLKEKPNDDDVRKAYLNAIRLCPPDKDADTFQRIQEAYESIKTERLRRERDLFNSSRVSREDILGQIIRHSSNESQRPSLASIQALILQGIK